MTSGSGPPPFSRRDPPGDAPGTAAPAPRLNGSARHDEPVVDLRTPQDPTSLRPDLAASLSPAFGTSAGAASDPTDPWEPVSAKPWDPVDSWEASEPSGGSEPLFDPARFDPPPSHHAEPLPDPAPPGVPPQGPSTGSLFGATVTGPVAGPPRSTPPSPQQQPTVPPSATPPAAAVGAHPGSLTAGIVRLFLLPLLALAVAGLAAVLLVQRGGDGEDRAVELSRAAAEQREAGATVDRLWSGVLGLVATGVGQEVATSAEVQELVGRARAAAPGAAGGDPSLDVRTRFIDAVDEAVGGSAGDPLELGNSLAQLDALHQDAVEGVRAAASDLEQQAQDARGGSGTDDLLAYAVFALGIAVAVVMLLRARARLHDRIELPVARLRDAVQRFGAGETDVRVRVGGAPELSELGQDLDEVLVGLGDRIDELHRRAQWGEQSRMILDALDLADDEPSLFEVVTRALGVIDPASPVELLMVERAPSRLTLVASNPHLPPPGEPVDTHGVCIALRRGQVTVFDSTSSINSCPMLRARAGRPVSGACVPVNVSGRPVGVLHMTGPEHQPPDPHVVERLVSLASQIGNRLGSLRTLETTRQEAATDGLTGLPNRRALESEVAQLLDRGTPFVMVLADLDKFKRLNDNFGHEVGDKALQLFAGVLRDNVRGNDVVARLGGEEFVLVYPNMSVEISIEAIGRLRAALARAVAASPVPAFTCSFGVTHSSVGGDGESILRVADAGLLRAKELGGDQAVFADAEIAAAIFAEYEAADRAGQRQHDDRR